MNCETNDCQREKRTCKGCFFEDKKESEKIIEENYKSMLCIGEYVRTKNGIIAKLEDVTEDNVYFFDRTMYTTYTDSIEFLREDELNKYVIKHSFNIIDLIEYGDYVNEEFVGSVNHEEKIVEIGEGWKVNQKDIKSIVTKQAFESIKYEV